jgi:hypothetical protein
LNLLYFFFLFFAFSALIDKFYFTQLYAFPVIRLYLNSLVCSLRIIIAVKKSHVNDWTQISSVLMIRNLNRTHRNQALFALHGGLTLKPDWGGVVHPLARRVQKIISHFKNIIILILKAEKNSHFFLKTFQH